MFSSLPQGLPERTLGWGVLAWCSKYLVNPDGKLKGNPWRFYTEQSLFILWYYAVDENGDYLYNRAVLERPKGWGKSPLLAAICCVELLGPVLFSHFDKKGNAIGQPQPSSWIQIAAISEDQTANTMSLVGEMLLDGPAADEYDLTVGIMKVTAPGDRKLTRVTSSPNSREGNRPTFVCMDETHLWLPVDKGPELAETLRRGVGKMDGRSIETTNAPVPGQGSVAEMSHDYWEMIKAGSVSNRKLLFDTREVVVEDIYDKELAFPALQYVYGDAMAHINLERVWEEINDPATKEHDARRYYFNQRVATASQWLQAKQWRAGYRDLKFRKKDDLYALGVKSITRESAAVVACRLVDGHLFPIKFWANPGDHRTEYEVPVHRLDDLVRSHLEKDNCVYLMVDPQTIQDVAGRWDVDYREVGPSGKGKVEGLWLQQKARHAKLVDSFEQALFGGRLSHNGDDELAAHIAGCHLEEATNGFTLRKERPYSTKYITGALAAILAFEARAKAIENGALEEAADNTLYGF